MREYRLLNNNWKFTYGDKVGASPDEINRWQDIGLPHSFGIPYFMEKEFYLGYGTYSKWFELSKEDCKKRILLKFFGAFQKAVVVLNGKQIGEHRGGYTPFLVELTGNIRPGQNHLIVCVDNLWDATLAPRGGEHQFNGGIYRDMQLILTAYDYIEEDGVFVQTTQLKKEKDSWHAELKIGTQVHASEKSDLSEFDSMMLETCICEGKEVLARSVEPLVMGNSEICQSISLTGITPWSPNSPKLYTVVSRVSYNGILVDCVRTSVGIRTVRFDKDEGFFLNGEHFSILGANVHQDHAGWADAVTRSGIRRDIQMIKECGMNTIRGSHYPHHPYFAQVCDEKGILFWSEMCFWGTGGDKQEGYWTASAYPPNESDQTAFEKSCLDQLEEMICTQRNHPSIICWSMCNEVFFTDAPVKDKAKELIRKMVERSHELDPSRPAAVGGAQRDGFDVLGDLAGYNGDGAALYHDPGFPSLVSEYGSSIETRPGKFEPRFTDGTEIDYPWRSGKILWCGFHHGSIFDGMGSMGMIDYYRLPLACWYWYREHLAGKSAPKPKKEGTPFQIRLSSDVNRFRANGQEDAWICAELLDQEGNPISNEIELTFTVEKGDGIFPTGKTITFSPEKKNMLDGLAAIEFRSWYGGENVICATADGVKSAKICIFADGEPKPKNTVLNPMLPPPYTVGEPKPKERYDEAKRHPVFADSFEIGHEPYFVTAEEEGSWMPKMSDSSKHLSEQMHWVMVDLEGVRRINQLEVSFEDEPDTLEKSKKNLPQTIVAELRSDLEWEKVILKRKKENQKGNDCKECYQAEGIYFTRYFRIDWNQTKLPVAQIHLWTGGEENE
ncbi:MAG: glycoside hydrolase family 2 TIM barrel-domain containing protein [Lachnospiraceae bacterium]|jgi:beta-galactosidase